MLYFYIKNEAFNYNFKSIYLQCGHLPNKIKSCDSISYPSSVDGKVNGLGSTKLSILPHSVQTK